MQGIELKEFQIDCVNKLLDATTVGNKKEILVQAPTGSGKTIIKNFDENSILIIEKVLFD